jgi:hypothetical protein
VRKTNIFSPKRAKSPFTRTAYPLPKRTNKLNNTSNSFKEELQKHTELNELKYLSKADLIEIISDSKTKANKSNSLIRELVIVSP